MSVRDLLSGFQCNYDKDGTSVHSTHAAGVAHEIVKDGCELSSHLLVKSRHVYEYRYHGNEVKKIHEDVNF